MCEASGSVCSPRQGEFCGDAKAVRPDPSALEPECRENSGLRNVTFNLLSL